MQQETAPRAARHILEQLRALIGGERLRVTELTVRETAGEATLNSAATPVSGWNDDNAAAEALRTALKQVSVVGVRRMGDDPGPR